MREIISLGKKIYNLGKWREQHRFVIFAARTALHREGVARLLRFFRSDPVRSRLLDVNPYPVEQATRAFFYQGSTFAERVRLIEEHYALLQERFTEEAFIAASRTDAGSCIIWEGEHEGEPLRAELMFEPGQRKEGLLSLELNLGERPEHVYQIMFWLAGGPEREPSLYIGALQGPNMEGAKDIIKQLTKACHGYRTKNLILFMLQAVARSMGLRHIYAVTNAGYYAQNHVRRDRKLKTDFGAFWQEAGGRATADPRFYELPLTEPRKALEEVPTRKRALYRRRFAFLDAVDEEIAGRMGCFMGRAEGGRHGS